MAQRQLVEVFGAGNVPGTLYLGYPILLNAQGNVKVDALYVSPFHGVWAFDLEHGNNDPGKQEEFEEIESSTERLYNALHSKLLEDDGLVKRSKLQVPVNVITLSVDQSFDDEYVRFLTIDQVNSALQQGVEIPRAYYERLCSVIERTATIRPKKQRAAVSKTGSRGAIIKEIEKKIANLDAFQKKAAIEIPSGVQRIRGLAGSGKTIVLALKAAFLHTKNPDWQIVITFQTRTLYQQFRRLVRQFCFEFSKSEPDWSKLLVMHAWGGATTPGLYTSFAEAASLKKMTFSEASSKYGQNGAFRGACSELLQASKAGGEIRPIYDVILIDEAQDFPAEFFELVFLYTKDPKRIVYAYDELQNLSDFDMLPAESLFGVRPDGTPNVELRNEPGRARSDIVLPICYRNSPWNLTAAHGLGFGTAREQAPNEPSNLIQLFDGSELWTDIGYSIVQGPLTAGSHVRLRRDEASTPAFFSELLSPEESLRFIQFDTLGDEVEWVANQIASNVNEDELELDDILVVIPDPYTSRSIGGKLIKSLGARGIGGHLVGVTSSLDEVFTSNSVAITSIYRAKGNEAPFVYVLGAESCSQGFGLARKRNMLFTAMTRSRAWVRVTGTGPSMANLIAEFNRIRQSNFELNFIYPTQEDLKKIRLLHRDRPQDEIDGLRQDQAAVERILLLLKSGQISASSLSPEIQAVFRNIQ
jgi:superfamily I DNA and RNA helicase